VRAVGVRRFGGPDSLEVLELPEPQPGPGQVLITVTGAAVNPADTALVAGFVPPGLPPREAWVPGMDVSGHLDGEPVVAIVIPFEVPVGGYAEQVVVPALSVAPAPRSIPLVHAAALPMNGLTAQRSLDQLDLRPGQWLAVTGAAGTYGGYVVQLAKDAGLHVIADASDADTELVSSLGADVVVPRGTAFCDAVRSHLPRGADGLADGAVLDAAALPAVRDGGRVASVRGWKGPADRGIQVFPTWVSRYRDEQAKLARLCRLVDEGALTVRVHSVVPVTEAADAHRRLASGGQRGRTVLDLTARVLA
jgi:NADPH:quinone reductase-like Zn-dependent oxidoreductase